MVMPNQLWGSDMAARYPTLEPDALDMLIDWKVYKVLGIKEAREKGEHTMQYQFTLELRVDFEDKDKNEIMKEAVRAAAKHMYATAALLADRVKPQIAIFSDDFFNGSEAVDMLKDTVNIGKDALTAAGSEEGDTAVSDELLAAASLK